MRMKSLTKLPPKPFQIITEGHRYAKTRHAAVVFIHVSSCYENEINDAENFGH